MLQVIEYEFRPERRRMKILDNNINIYEKTLKFNKNPYFFLLIDVLPEIIRSHCKAKGRTTVIAIKFTVRRLYKKFWMC